MVLLFLMAGPSVLFAQQKDSSIFSKPINLKLPCTQKEYHAPNKKETHSYSTRPPIR